MPRSNRVNELTTIVSEDVSQRDGIERKLPSLRLNESPFKDELYPDGEENDMDEEVEIESFGARTAAEKRMEQKGVFDDWFHERVASITKEEVRETLKRSDEESLSLRGLLAKQESDRVISDPREYQLELFDRAKKENTIAVLDTGSGKTLIAVLLLRHIIDQELERRELGEEEQVAFFLVDSVTLVFQQAAVLRCNLNHEVAQFCGAMGTELWSKEVWAKQFAEHKVIVCTADVLLQCLLHGFISISKINLLVFDEAHHAKKDHAYARIIKDFYLAEGDKEKRPKIFGMTASPVDAKVDVKEAAQDLETLLHSRIATTSDLALLRKTVFKPIEEVAVYRRLTPPFETALHTKLKTCYGRMSVFRKLFDASKGISAELGAWCSDIYWSFALTEKEARKVEMTIERSFNHERKAQPVEIHDAEIQRLKEAQELIAKYDFGVPNADNVSSKVLKLHDWLQRYFDQPSDARCIVFVTHRHTARLLNAVFREMGGEHLRPGALVGSASSSLGDPTVSYRQQVMTLIQFRKGVVNCLFATSIAEEGLDVPDCNLIVRFDLYRTVIQYIQSRGRARHRNSRYLHMLEEGNSAQHQRVLDVRRDEALMRRFCESLPEDRLLEGNDRDWEYALVKEHGAFRTYTEKKTGAKLTYNLSLSVLAHFVGCLPHGHDSIQQPQYIVTASAGKFQCEAILPENSPIRTAIGRRSSKKSIAKRSAAFQMCFLLRRGQYLDENLLPIYTKQLPAMRNAMLALNSKKTNMYDMKTKPSLWEGSRGVVPTELFPTVVSFTNDPDKPYQPLILLTRTPMPEFPSFPLHMSTGKQINTAFKRMKLPLHIQADDLEKITTFTLRIFLDVFNKKYEVDAANLSYWLAPLRRDSVKLYESSDVRMLVDWDILRVVQTNEEYTWTPETTHAFLLDRFLVDRWDGGRRFYSVSIAPDLRPSDPVPAGTAKAKFNDSILDYSVSLFKNARAKRVWDPSQPVIKAEKVLHRRNWLAEADAKETEGKVVSYLCPEPLKISVLPTAICTTALMFPAIIHRIESYLIAMEICQTLDLDVSPALALEALTKDSENSDEFGEEKINFQRGMGKNYERLEFIGDAFLKMATSISLFAQNPDDNEFEYHVKRMCMICNKNLFNTAKEMKIYEHVRSLAFSRRTWYPEGLKLLEGKGSKNQGLQTMKQSLGDKTIADVCEALIGAAFVHNYRPETLEWRSFDQAVTAVTGLVNNEDHAMKKWDDYYKAYKIPAWQSAPATASHRDLAAKAARTHSYEFKYARLLRSSFMHSSEGFLNTGVPSYQRLEFLGDSLLDMTSICHLFYNFPNKDPQWLTEHKMAMVSNKFLGALCVQLGFHKHLLYRHDQLGFQIREYVEEVQEAGREAKGAKDYWMTVRDPPKCLPDIVESYVGAVFVDSEFDYGEVQRFFDMHIKPFFEDMSIYDSYANNHPTTKLHHQLETVYGCQDFRIMAGEVPSMDGTPSHCLGCVMIHGKVMAEGRASAAKNAKKKASEHALDLLHGLMPLDFRRLYGCGCKKEDPAGKDDPGERVRQLVGLSVEGPDAVVIDG